MKKLNSPGTQGYISIVLITLLVLIAVLFFSLLAPILAYAGHGEAYDMSEAEQSPREFTLNDFLNTDGTLQDGGRSEPSSSHQHHSGFGVSTTRASSIEEERRALTWQPLSTRVRDLDANGQ